MVTGRHSRSAAWGALAVVLAVASCGDAFQSGWPGAEGAAAGAAAQAGEAGVEAGGQGQAGTHGAGEAPGGASAGEPRAGAGAGGERSCEELGGYAHGGHCYVDVTRESVPFAEARQACEDWGAELGLEAHLLVLNSEDEQAFILHQFLDTFVDRSDAWLGISCAEATHPDILDCYCSSCSAAELEEKQRAWTWLDGTTARFGWINGNPNGASRCAALGYNPDITVMTWGWVERPCDQAEVRPIVNHPHTYRVLCEWGQ